MRLQLFHLASRSAHEKLQYFLTTNISQNKNLTKEDFSCIVNIYILVYLEDVITI